MPTLRTWQCLAPAHWNEDQLANYIEQSTLSLAIGMAPIIQIITPLGAVNVLLAVLAKVAMENKPWIPQILDAMANFAEALDTVPPSTDQPRMQ